ncbi:CDF family Co(II)/Ni(II) efflux transporter DmeF [Aliikangiella sp. G2MR2-5]|uniref:CDF family Co(II)/Ni(II) efflux transporter DmeF n=1 Tax=Aliikangiella sp. G2MR2-5 TaxID=2788943 RepID=UPI0018AB7E9A|nr:CDF family Co(II)/Ni(II) efflux transporter DmeF [Aliikangiella sp. G2MR2-5]
MNKNNHSIKSWEHDHSFALHNQTGERKTWYVLYLTAVVMLIEILAGSLFGSMALLADGWHMGTHVAAFMITLFAYRYARKNANNPAFTFGTGKVSVLGGFASAVALAVVALVMAIESIFRIVEPHSIQFNEAIGVAILGLVVNLVSAFLLMDHHHEHAHEHGHSHDHNLRAAYMHVLADALTSVLAIVALFAGKYFGWYWMDPTMGIVGAIIIARWSFGLVRQTGPILLDASATTPDKSAVVAAIEADADNQVVDCHIWQIGSNHYALILSIVTHSPNRVEHYKELLSDFTSLEHITVEVNECRQPECERLA